MTHEGLQHTVQEALAWKAPSTGTECQRNMVQFQAKCTHHEKEKASGELKYIKTKCEAFLDAKVVTSTEWPKGHLEEKCSLKIESFLVVLKEVTLA